MLVADSGTDPLAVIPEPSALRRLIAEQVERTELLRRLLRVSLRREQLREHTAAAEEKAVANAH